MAPEVKILQFGLMDPGAPGGWMSCGRGCAWDYHDQPPNRVGGKEEPHPRTGKSVKNLKSVKIMWEFQENTFAPNKGRNGGFSAGNGSFSPGKMRGQPQGSSKMCRSSLDFPFFWK